MAIMHRPTVDRNALLERYARNRRRTEEMFGLIAPQQYENRSILLRHPPVFYEGHIPAFSFMTLVRNALGRPSVDETLEALFRRGIDPDSVDAADQHKPAAWPSRDRVREFGRACDAAVIDAFQRAELDVPANPALEYAQAAYNILEHEEMHHETFAYIMQRMPLANKRNPLSASAYVDVTPPQQRSAAIAAGTATIGAQRGAIQFGWDNEFDEMQVDVPAFECDVYPVTNGDWLRFVRAGGPVPSFWLANDDGYLLLGAFETMPLPLSWPVWVTNAQAQAYAAWAGRRVMTEPEYHRAAFGTPDGPERVLPWGDAPATSAHGNFDWRRWDPEPVGASPAGASAWGVQELVGNGWEHTASPFAPLPNFAPMASYPQYSEEFFDGRHTIVKGASPVTARGQVRRSLRNWYRADYPYVFAKFRTVSS